MSLPSTPEWLMNVVSAVLAPKPLKRATLIGASPVQGRADWGDFLTRQISPMPPTGRSRPQSAGRVASPVLKLRTR